MKILILNEAAVPLGGEMNHYVLDVAARLRASGDAVALVHGRGPKAEFRGARYIFDHLRKMNAPEEEVRVRLEAIVDDFRPDVIQIHGVPNLALDRWLVDLAPTVRWVHNHLLTCSGGTMTWRWPRRPCQRAHGPACLAMHALRGCGGGDPVRNLVRYRKVSRSLGVLRSLPWLQVASGVMKENLIRNGVDLARIEQIPLYAPPPASPEMRKAFPGRRRFVLHAGGLCRQKGARLLVREIGRLPEDVDLVFAGGSGELERSLKKEVAARQLSGRVRIMGEVSPEQWRQLFCQAALVVVPSLWNEPLGLGGLYAMAHGKAVVAFDGGGIGEWLEDGHTGVAVAPEKGRAAGAAFMDAVAALLADPTRLEKLGSQAAERWNARFRPEHHLEALRACYHRMKQERGNP